MLALTLVFAYIMIYPYYIYDPQIELSPFPPLSPDDSILVLAPHPDDELLGAAGLLLEAEEKGVEAKIVIATNGDGYPWAARFSKYKFVVSSKDLIALGEKRMAESKSGIKRLGLSEEQLIFLGYPDRGLMPIWLEFWDQPFTSRFTRSSQAPYTGLYNNMELPYSGQYLVKTLKDLLLEFQPTIIVTPHPLDSHPDHCALTCFMLYAGELAKANGYTPRHVFGYLVHRGTWPHPRGYRPELGLNPPRSLGNLDLEWISLDLSPEAIKLKARAIREHRNSFQKLKQHFCPTNSSPCGSGIIPNLILWPAVFYHLQTSLEFNSNGTAQSCMSWCILLEGKRSPQGESLYWLYPAAKSPDH